MYNSIANKTTLSQICFIAKSKMYNSKSNENCKNVKRQFYFEYDNSILNKMCNIDKKPVLDLLKIKRLPDC